MNTLNNSRPKGLSRQALKIWGLLLIAAGAVGQGIIMNKMMGMQGLDSITAVEQVLGSNERNIVLGIISLLLQMAFACAIPIYTFLMVDGFQRTSSVKFYALRVAGVALLTEIPYNLCMSGKWIDLASRNPMIAMALGMAMLFMYQYFWGVALPSLPKWITVVMKVAICAMVFLFGFVWVVMLDIHHGYPILMMISVLWFLRKSRALQILVGSAMMFVCSSFPEMEPVYWLAPVVFLVAFFYNEEKGESNKIIEYLAMPVILLIVGLIAQYAM
jgi:hypothetical protein